MIFERMDTKVLLRLIRDDIKILDNINDSFINQSALSFEEAEVALARARALVMEFEMLSKNLSPVEEPQTSNPLKEEEKTEKKFRSFRNFLPFIKSGEENSTEPELADEKEEENFTVQTNGQGNVEPVVNSSNTVSLITSEEAVFMNQKQVVTLEEEKVPINTDHSTVAVEEKELEKTTEPSTVAEEIMENEIAGENIGDKQLINELLVEEKNESRFEIKSLKTIREGIGLNDRFLFIRELFNNDTEKFNQTVTTLDELTEIEDAVKFLKQNFKWNKSEATEKFLLLVKRRFAK